MESFFSFFEKTDVSTAVRPLSSLMFTEQRSETSVFSKKIPILFYIFLHFLRRMFEYLEFSGTKCNCRRNMYQHHHYHYHSLRASSLGRHYHYHYAWFNSTCYHPPPGHTPGKTRPVWPGGREFSQAVLPGGRGRGKSK